MRNRSRSRENSVSQEGRAQYTRDSSGARFRWWQWRSWRTLRRRGPDDADAEVQGDSSLYLTLDRMCQQVAALLPSVSVSTRKAIFCCVVLLVMWRVILWALEMLVTSVCFAVALGIVVCFFRPDLALVLVTEVLPPYIDAARGWLSSAFLSAALFLTRRPLHPTSAPAPSPLAIEDLSFPAIFPTTSEPQPQTLSPPSMSPPSPHPAHREAPRPRPRTHNTDSQPTLIEATA